VSFSSHAAKKRPQKKSYDSLETERFDTRAKRGLGVEAKGTDPNTFKPCLVVKALKQMNHKDPFSVGEMGSGVNPPQITMGQEKGARAVDYRIEETGQTGSQFP